MSHLTKIKIDILSIKALQRAAEALGLQFREKKTYKWYGHHVGDYPMPEGMTAEMLGKCDYALGIPGNSDAYEVGVVRRENGSFSLLWDFWQGGYGLQNAIGADGNKLVTEYTIQAAVEAAENQGWYVERSGDTAVIHHPDGGIITVDATGAVDATQFSGSDCVTACAPIEGALGSQSERILKNEFYQKKQIQLQGE